MGTSASADLFYGYELTDWEGDAVSPWAEPFAALFEEKGDWPMDDDTYWGKDFPWEYVHTGRNGGGSALGLAVKASLQSVSHDFTVIDTEINEGWLEVLHAAALELGMDPGQMPQPQWIMASSFG